MAEEQGQSQVINKPDILTTVINTVLDFRRKQGKWPNLLVLTEAQVINLTSVLRGQNPLGFAYAGSEHTFMGIPIVTTENTCIIQVTDE